MSVALSDSMESRSNSIDGKLLVETERGEFMHDQPAKLKDGVHRQPHSLFDILIEERGTIGDAVARFVGFQSRGQLRECRFVEVLTVLVFYRSLWDEVDLFKEFQATEAEP